jgi:hypothetical protein
MKEFFSKHARGEDFMKDPRLAASGVLIDVVKALPLSQHPAVQVVQARLRGEGVTGVELALTIMTPDMEKSVVEVQVKPEAREVIKEFFDRQAIRDASPETNLPKLSPLSKLLEMAEDVTSRVAERRDWKGASTAHTQALGDAIGIATILNDEARAFALAVKLKTALGFDGDSPVSPRCFLNAIAPAIRAALATDQMESLDAVVSAVLPKNYKFLDVLSPEADLSRFAIALREFMEDRGYDEAVAFLDQFSSPNVSLRILNEAVDACVTRGSARSINTCSQVVRAILPECKDATLFVNEAGIRLRAFEGAMSSDWAAAEKILDDMPRWSRSDPLIGWLAGYVVGLKVRSDHTLAPAPAVNQLNTLLLSGNDEYFEKSAAQFVRGLVAATQGRNGKTSEPILQRIEDQHVTLEKMPAFLSARFAHQLVVASRSANEANIEFCLKDLVSTAQVLGEDGDALLTAMCEELFSDVTIRDFALRNKIAATIASVLRDPTNEGRFEGTRLLAGSILFDAGFPKAALKAPPALVIGESGRLVWHIRAMDVRSREFGRVSALKFEQLDRSVDALKTYTDYPASEWAAVLEEAAAVAKGLPMAMKALNRAIKASTDWSPSDVALLNEAVCSGLLRRAKSVR